MSQSHYTQSSHRASWRYTSPISVELKVVKDPFHEFVDRLQRPKSLPVEVFIVLNIVWTLFR